MTDLCLLNGAFCAQDPDRPRAMAAAIRLGRFAAVGDDEIRKQPVVLWRSDPHPAVEPSEIAEAQMVMMALGATVVYRR